MTINLKHESNAFILFQGDDGKKEELFLSRIARVFFAFLESRSRLAREKASSVSSSAFADSHFFGYGKAMMTNWHIWIPSFFLFVCFGGMRWWTTTVWAYLPKTKNRSGSEERRIERCSFFFKFAVSLLMRVNSKAMMIKKISCTNPMKPQGVIDIKSTLSLRRKCTSFLSFENGSLTRWYFLTHTQKKYWKHAGGIFKQINTLWREHQRVATKKQYQSSSTTTTTKSRYESVRRLDARGAGEGSAIAVLAFLRAVRTRRYDKREWNHREERRHIHTV